MSMKTDFDTLRTLAVYTIDNLYENKIIEFGPDQRMALIDAMATELGVSFATDEDIKDQAIEDVEEKMGADNMPDDITESEMFNHARKEIIKGFNGENISGLYLVESLRETAIRMKNFLLTSDHVEDVFGTDDEIVSFLIRKIRNFSVRRTIA